MPSSRNVLRGSAAVLAALLVLPAFAQQGWSPYQFEANERYKYSLKWTRGGETSTGYYALRVTPAGDRRLKVEVEAKLGETECNAAVTVDSAEAVPHQMMTSCMMVAPVAMMFWGPTAGYWMGRELTDDDEWSFRHGDESMSFNVEGDCTYAGQTGKRTVMKQNGNVRVTACIAMHLSLPAAVSFNEESGDSMEATLEEYSK